MTRSRFSSSSFSSLLLCLLNFIDKFKEKCRKFKKATEKLAEMNLYQSALFLTNALMNLLP